MFWSRDQLRNLLILRKWYGFEKPKSLLFCLRYDPLIVFQRQSHITFIFIKMMSHDLLVQIAYFKKTIINGCLEKPETRIGTETGTGNRTGTVM